jgi:NADP-dependent 3-hydroxy acid dehydrogenase YdfG
MASQELTDTTALVTGASRGFGRAVAVALRNAGANVVAVARSAEQLGESHDQLGGSLTTVARGPRRPSRRWLTPRAVPGRRRSC